MALIALVRHGETDYNKNLIIQGQIDIPLNELGKLQAYKTAKHFQNEEFDVIISSPLIRAKETAQIIAKEINYDKKIIIDENFIERNFGEADGKSISEYIDLVHQDEVEGLETEEDIKNRVLMGIRNVCKNYENQNIMIVCHSHSIKAVLAALDNDKYNFTTPLTNCSINLLEFNNDDIIIKKVNYNDYI